jgi:hypothetical protein
MRLPTRVQAGSVDGSDRYDGLTTSLPSNKRGKTDRLNVRSAQITDQRTKAVPHE